MLDTQSGEQQFFYCFRRNYEEINPTRSMAHELHKGARIYMSGADNIGLLELAI